MIAYEGTTSLGGKFSFMNNSAEDSGGAIHITGGSTYIVGEPSSAPNNSGGTCTAISSEAGAYFINNNSSKGGALYIYVPDEFEASGTAFIGNYADDVGGGVFLRSEDHASYYTGSLYYRLEECWFVGNGAGDGGGLYQDSEIHGFSIKSSVFEGNYAEKLGGAISQLGSMELEGTCFVGNAAGLEGLAIQSYDSIETVGSEVVFDNNMYRCPEGEFGLSRDNTHPDVDETCRIELSCSRCGATCEDPEIWDWTTLPENEVPVCEPVPVGSKISSVGTTVYTLELERGHYRVSNASDDVLVCHRKQACKGGVDAENYCAPGYVGPYCAVCAHNFSSGFFYSCHTCSERSKRLTIGVGTIVTTVALFIVGVIVHELVRKIDDGTEEQAGETGQSFQRRPSCLTCLSKAFPRTALKIVVVVWQITTQFAAVAGDVYPEAYETFLSVISTINLDIGIFVSYSCIFSPDFYDRLVLATVGPLVLIAALGVTYQIGRKRNQGSAVALRAVADKHLSAGLFLVFFIYSSVSFTIFQTFGCDKLDDGFDYLRADYSKKCATDGHHVYEVYACVMVILYPIGIPATFTWWLIRNRADLQKPERNEIVHLKAFKSVWGAYRPSRYYYEVIECARRMALTVVAVFVTPDSSAQIAVVLLIAVVFLFIGESLSPFTSYVDMGLYRWGNGIVLANMYLALLFRVDVSKERRTSFANTMIAAHVVLVITILVEAALLVKGQHQWVRAPSVRVVEVDLPRDNRTQTRFLEDRVEEVKGETSQEVKEQGVELRSVGRTEVDVPRENRMFARILEDEMAMVRGRANRDLNGTARVGEVKGETSQEVKEQGVELHSVGRTEVSVPREHRTFARFLEDEMAMMRGRANRDFNAQGIELNSVERTEVGVRREQRTWVRSLEEGIGMLGGRHNHDLNEHDIEPNYGGGMDATVPLGPL